MRKRMMISTSMFASAIGFLLSTNGTVAGGSSEYSSSIEFLFLAGMVVSIGLGLFVLIMLAYLLFRYRENTSVVRKKIKNEMKLEIAWTLIALVLVGVAFVLTVPVLSEIVSPPGTDETYEMVMIEGHQFSWQFYYESVPAYNQTSGDIEVDSSNKYPGFPYQSRPDEINPKLYLQVGKTYLLNVTSVDVIHSFYVYDLSFKIDAVPGTFNVFKLKILKAGEYEIKCAEYCGFNHYGMYGTLIAYE